MATRNGTTTGKLTAKQQRFVEEYLIDPNGTQAAIRAGYSARTADRIAYENLRKPEIDSAIRRAQAATQERLEGSPETRSFEASTKQLRHRRLVGVTG